jgi:hypothetical protein
MTKPTLVVLLTLSIPCRPAGLDAQSVDPAAPKSLALVGGTGWLSLWDDETFLGNGVLVSAGVSKPVAAHLAIEGEVAWASHQAMNRRPV